MLSEKTIAIVGGCGHVGLPLGVKFALGGAKVFLVDVNQTAVDTVNGGTFPFLELGGDKQLQSALSGGLTATTDASVCRSCDVVVFVIGTPVDEHLNPKVSDVFAIFDSYQDYFSKDTLIIMRSTLFPGTMEHIQRRVASLGKNIKLAFCPERVAQGYALDEIDSLPQIVSAFDDESFEAAYDVFKVLAPSVIRLAPIEAELTKLMANSWRYLEFAIANQFYMIAESKGVDFYKIYEAIRYDYPRAKGYKSPGFAAGPCLFKDTMQLASFFDHQFSMGHAAMLVNEGLANVVVEKTKAALGGEIWGKTVGLLGMTFKSDNDDIRESLSYRVKKALEFAGAKTVFHDPYLAESEDFEAVMKNSDAYVLCTPHKEYLNLKLTKPIVDVWGIYNKPELEVLPGHVEEQTRLVANS